MSKRAEEKAAEAYPNPTLYCFENRNAYTKGYEQGEKDTIDRAAKWIRDNWREYIMGPDKDGMIGFGHWENDFRKTMEE